MAFSTQYAQQYQQAVSAYMQGHYETAAEISSTLVLEYPDDPNLQLLCGHIHSCLKQYDTAQQYYKQVLRATNDPELLNCAQNSLIDLGELMGSGSNPPPGQSARATESWSDLSEYSEGEATQIQLGLVAKNSRIEEQSRSLNVAEYREMDSSSASELQAGWRSLLVENQDFNDQFLTNSDLEESSDLFEEEEEITLLMGKKGSHTPEGSMSDTQSDTQVSGKPADSAEHPLAMPQNADAFSINRELPEDLTSVQGLSSPAEGYSEDFSDFLSHMDSPAMADESDLENIDRSAPLNTTAELDLTSNLDEAYITNQGTTPQSWDNFTSSGADGLANDPQHPVVSAGSSARKPLKYSDETAALNIVSRQIPLLAAFENAPLQKKPIIMAASSGIVSGLAVLIVGQLSTGGSVPLTKLGLSALAAGLAGGAATLALGQVVTRQLKASTSDLQTKLSAVAQGDWSVKAIEFSKDEFGQLAKSFNKMTHFIEVTTQDTQRKADEQEKAKEDLQRQVIRLLDDVEGAARGDLTVQAEVTADILGAVADSFNLTIYNLQKIVKQVKVAAREVNKGAADNEEFARGLSSDALRQAEELAATLNSVQMMTTSIQEVADSARAADNVAQKASEAALKGGESVESTVAGILQIRETVAETTRKVKRLAESSQEISKIVGLISQIASRTNLLALNASIEAARAGESGRGFAVVADEVRQLADRAAKASKEIEQIVLQIQGETSSVMTAMEEGTQQVIEGTQRAEQAKNSLEDIIQVSEQIKQLVGSITKATSEQTETSRYVGQVMQSVELTAQETSQEAQRVSDSLRSLVGVARDLQSSVERFKVEGTEFS
jgi:twitching motility protein PilJ